MVQLPFTRDAFFNLFADYNATLWPAVAALWVASALVCARLPSWRRPSDRWIGGLLAVHWGWAAVAYHIVFFTRINPAAWLFAALFLVQAALFLWHGVIRGQVSFAPSPARTAWTSMGWLLIVYALLYPVINAAQHASLVRIPTFGLPCPTTILTVGLFLMAGARVKTLAIVPLIWSAIGGSAAFLLGVGADYVLPVAGAVLAMSELRLTTPVAKTTPPAAPHSHG